jgi:hypothetical protein
MRLLGRLVVAGLIALAGGSSRLAAAAADGVVPREELSQKVVVRNVVVDDDGGVSGVLANTSRHRVKEVRLLIRHEWLWRNEFHPGTDSPGSAGYYVVPQEIPPGGSVSFTYRPDQPLPRRSDGTFQTTVEVAGLLEYPDEAAPEAGAPPPRSSGAYGD